MMTRSTMTYRLTALAVLALIGTPMAANAQAGGADTGFVRHDITVETVDPAAHQAPNTFTHQPDRHLVLAPTTARKRLFLYIEGTTIATSMGQDILRTAVRRGYHVISLAYHNGETVAALCRNAPDADCTGKVREEILTGEDVSPLVSIAKPDAVEPRLYRLLAYLKNAFPDEGWGDFLGQDGVDWSLVSVAGHSQGAGHVALLAKRHALLRAVMISGVADVTGAGRTAPWLFRPSATPLERQYGFSHVADPVVPLAVAKASWKAIGLDTFGPPQSIDAAQAPYGGSHELTTAHFSGANVNPHLAMGLDRFLPRDEHGEPLYTPVWQVMALP